MDSQPTAAASRSAASPGRVMCVSARTATTAAFSSGGPGSAPLPGRPLSGRPLSGPSPSGDPPFASRTPAGPPAGPAQPAIAAREIANPLRMGLRARGPPGAVAECRGRSGCTTPTRRPPPSPAPTRGRRPR
ncbi:MAG: hypothetical protein ACK559_21230, partial [bacterium]